MGGGAGRRQRAAGGGRARPRGRPSGPPGPTPTGSASAPRSSRATATRRIASARRSTRSSRPLMARHPDRSRGSTYERILGVMVERERARYGAWYEIFPRSCSPEPGRHGTFRDVEARLPYVADMGFDVLYLPPIHPIGRSFRKGPNNTLTPGPDDPGSPWAIGGPEGGHKAIHPELGTLEDFDRLVGRREGAGPGDRAGHRLPVLARPPLRPRASRVVPAPARRHDQVRREPAQEVPGHLPDRLRVRRLGGALRRAPRRLPLLDRPRGDDLPRGQPAHQAVPVLGLGHPRGLGPATPTPSSWPRRSPGPKVMRRLAKGGYLAVLQLLHLAEHQVGADGVLHRADPERVGRLHEAEPVRQHARHPPRVPPVRRPARVPWPGWCSRRPSGRPTGSTAPRSSSASARPSGRARRSTSTPRSTRCGTGTSTGRGTSATSSPGSTPSAARTPRSTHDRNLRFYPIDNEQLIFYGKATPDLSNIILVVVNLDPHHVHSGWLQVPIGRAGPGLGPGPVVPGPRPDRRRPLPLARRVELRPARPVGLPRAHLPGPAEGQDRAGFRLLYVGRISHHGTTGESDAEGRGGGGSIRIRSAVIRPLRVPFEGAAQCRCCNSRREGGRCSKAMPGTTSNGRPCPRSCRSSAGSRARPGSSTPSA